MTKSVFLHGPEGRCITEHGLDQVWPRDPNVEPLDLGAGKGLTLPPTCDPDAPAYTEAQLWEFFDGPPVPAVPLPFSVVFLGSAIVLAFVISLVWRGSRND